MTDPLLRIKLEDAAGKPLMAPVELRIQEGLSPKLAKMLLLELVVKRFKTAVPDVLVALGFK